MDYCDALLAARGAEQVGALQAHPPVVALLVAQGQAICRLVSLALGQAAADQQGLAWPPGASSRSVGAAGAVLAGLAFAGLGGFVVAAASFTDIVPALTANLTSSAAFSATTLTS